MLLSAKDATHYRSLAMRVAYLAQDRTDLQFAVKERARGMSKPTRDDQLKLKCIGRYLKGRPRAVIVFNKQQLVSYVDVFGDSDWAGCIKTRKSTNGGVLMIGSHCIKSWSLTQSTIAMSSGEAEYYAVVKAASVLLGVNSCERPWSCSEGPGPN